MLFVIRFTDRPDNQKTRKRHLTAHLSWLKERRDVILAAGSLREEPEQDPIGAFWVVEAESKDEVTELFKTDPFWINKLRDRVEIYHWSKAFPDEQRPI